MNKRLTDESERIVRLGTQAWKRLKNEKSWNDWMAVGEALLIGRTFAMNDAGTNQPLGKGYNLAFNQWLIDAKLSDMDASDRAKLFTVMDNRPAIEQWRVTLTQTDRLRLNHPTTVLRKWQQSTTVKPPKEPRSTRRDEVIELSEENMRLKARITELEEEVASLREQRTPELENA